MESLKTIILLLILPLAYCAVYFVSEVRTKTYADSPDGHWRAAVRLRREASIFSEPEISVTLQPNDSWVQRFSRGEKIFAIEQTAVSQAQLEWRSSDELVVRLTKKTPDASVTEQISRQLTQYNGVRISYEIVSSQILLSPQEPRYLFQ